MLLPLVDRAPDWMEFIIVVAVFVFLLWIFDRIIKCLSYNDICYKKLEDEFFEQEQQQEDAEQEKLEAQQAKLSHLEELSQTKNPPAWVFVAFAILGIWVLLFLFFVCPVLSEAPETVT